MPDKYTLYKRILVNFVKLIIFHYPRLVTWGPLLVIFEVKPCSLCHRIPSNRSWDYYCLWYAGNIYIVISYFKIKYKVYYLDLDYYVPLLVKLLVLLKEIIFTSILNIYYFFLKAYSDSVRIYVYLHTYQARIF